MATGQSAAPSRVLNVPAASPSDAARYFAARLACETDCSDVFHDLEAGVDGFVVIDARGRADYDAAHLPGAISVPHRDIGPDTVARIGSDTLVVTYCWGPHCNAATQAAARFAALGVRVKEMLGGIDGWRHEGYRIERG